MNLLARDPFFDFDRIFDGLYRPSRTRASQFNGDNTPDNSAANSTTANTGVRAPRVDILEREGSYELIAELPGVGKNDISVTVEDAVLTIEASVEHTGQEQGQEQEQVQEAETGKWLRRERHTGKYLRSFKLGEDIDSAEIKASFNDGLLTLQVPKAQPAVVQRKIEVH